jgi:hypothetical protein
MYTILLATPFGAIDPDDSEAAMTVDFKSTLGTKSTFGAGPHVCPDSMPTRLELKIALDPDDWPEIRTGVNGSFAVLPLTWSA